MKKAICAIALAAMITSPAHARYTELQCYVDKNPENIISIQLDEVNEEAIVSISGRNGTVPASFAARMVTFNIGDTQVWSISRTDLSFEILNTVPFYKHTGRCSIQETPPQAF